MIAQAVHNTDLLIVSGSLVENPDKFSMSIEKHEVEGDHITQEGDYVHD